jgi:hypothetical protein
MANIGTDLHKASSQICMLAGAPHLDGLIDARYREMFLARKPYLDK